MIDNNYTSDISKDTCPSTVCYSIRCNNPATVSVKIPLNQSLCCLVHVCNSCLPKYEIVNNVDDTNKHFHVNGNANHRESQEEGDNY